MDRSKIKVDRMMTKMDRAANGSPETWKPWTENKSRDQFANRECPEFPSFGSECCSLVGMLCVLFCCGPCQNSLPWTLRVVPFCACVLFLAVLVVSVIQYGYYRDRNFHLSPTDILRVVDNRSAAFCSEFDLDSTSRFTAYLFDQQPVVNQDVKTRHMWTETVFVQNNKPVEKSLLLLKGSVMKLKICPDYNLNFCAIEGEKAFQSWTKHKSPSNCFQSGKINREKCRSVEMKSKNSGHIYFIFTATKSATWVDLTFTLNRTNYDVKKAVEFCDVTQHCQFSIPFHSRSTVVVSSFINGGADTVLKTHCSPGIMFYVFIFVIPVVACLVLGMVFVYVVRQDVNRKLDLDRRLNSVARRPADSHLKVSLLKSNLIHYHTFHKNSEIPKCLASPKNSNTFGSS
ncbi:uncharacterized protein LOC135472923 [Liolophura sinensis]|uniref:uncharacterized protein LOC135472923 n=1 Tax=Liolophura sinensis TaxID=3198878 RepID=UPI0031583EBE